MFELVERFRQKGATSPDKAMSLEELGLPPRFEYIMRGRLRKLGIFVEKDDKYYLSEERLKQLEERRSTIRVVKDSRKNLLMLRMVRIAVGILFISLLLVNIYVSSPNIKVACSILLVALLIISVLQLYYLTKVKKGGSPTVY